MAVDDLEPDEVLALRFDEPSAAEDLAAWCGGQVGRVIDLEPPRRPRVVVWVPTPEGDRAALLGDWIVREASGDFFPVTSEEFAVRYQPAEPPSEGGHL